jgi:hypothetical protein
MFVVVTYCPSVPNAGSVGHHVRNEALFKGASIQMTPRASGENRDIISSMGLATQRNRGRELVINIRCGITIECHNIQYSGTVLIQGVLAYLFTCIAFALLVHSVTQFYMKFNRILCKQIYLFNLRSVHVIYEYEGNVEVNLKAIHTLTLRRYERWDWLFGLLSHKMRSTDELVWQLLVNMSLRRTFQTSVTEIED